MNKKIILVLLAAALALPLAAAGASSKSSSTVSTSTPKQTSKAAKGAIARCPIIEAKIQAKVTGFDNTKIKHLTVYGNIKARLVKVADRLAATGADVTALRADLIVLDQKIAKFSADYASYIAKLKATQGFVCGRSEGEFKAQLKETKVALQWVHKDASDIRVYVSTTIKAEINKIRDSLKSKATTTPETVTSTKATSTRSTDKPDKPGKIRSIVPALPKLD